MTTFDTTENFMDADVIHCSEMQNMNEGNEWNYDDTVPNEPITAEGSQKQAKWSQLPTVPLELVYSFLSRSDQSHMAQVCRKWSEGYNSPSVWKTFKFHLPDTEFSTEIYPEIKSARKYGGMFRHVEIVCSRISATMSDIAWRQLKVFLHILTNNSQLMSVKFKNLGSYLHQLDAMNYDDIFRNITNFLESQQFLKKVEFHDCDFRFQESVELFKAMSEKSRESLTHLVFRGFVDDESENLEQNRVATESLPKLISERLSNLKILETDHSLFFDNMFSRHPNIADMLRNSQLHSLSKVILHCEGFKQQRYRGLTPTIWRCLRQVCPELVIELYFLPGSRPRREIEFFILPDMPITLLDFRLDRLHASSTMDINILFNHLLACRINNHLAAFYLVWMRSIPDLASALLPFLRACPKLKCLQMFTHHPVNDIEDILRSWLETRPESLDEVLISISNVRNEDDYMSLTTLADEYVPLLQVLGLNIFLIIDSNWR
ncbi:f-box domain-containing protein [Trichonephila inaurata madagascariensis]|uniref:F-box domain-containing protein n=1 Tax=Trichonephila inaurata madagascariensis TaxID=2747483 RepID=A0A8X6Y2V9_9ARAC|nr:f-box domain-containing protein [Trichonephila inaurata madagascariensis]